MAYGIKLHVWGEHALFTRPENKVERVSYEVMTPSSARGILEAIYWKPAIRWVIDKIHVLKPIQFQSIRRNEVDSKISMTPSKIDEKNQSSLSLIVEEHRQQRSSLILCDVAYLIEAHFEFTLKADQTDNEGKHLDIFNRRAREGKCFHRPCLGCREFPAHFTLWEKETMPESALKNDAPRDLGIMLYDIDFANNMRPIFYKPKLVAGIIHVAEHKKEAL